MNVDEFVGNIAEILSVDNHKIDPETNLKEMQEYDSFALISIIAFIDDHFNKVVPADRLSNVTTVQSLMELIGLENFK